MGVGKIRADKITTDIGNTLLSERTVDSSPDDAMVTRSYYKSNFVDKITNIENQAAEFSRHIDARLADMQARIDRLKLRLVEVNRLTIEKITGSVERTRNDITNTLTNEVNKARTDITNLNNSTWNGVKDEIARRLDMKPANIAWQVQKLFQDVYPGSSEHDYVHYICFWRNTNPASVNWSGRHNSYFGPGTSSIWLLGRDPSYRVEREPHAELGGCIRVILTKSGTAYSISIKTAMSGPGRLDRYVYADGGYLTDYGPHNFDFRYHQNVTIYVTYGYSSVWKINGVEQFNINTQPRNGYTYLHVTGSDSSHTQRLTHWYESYFTIEVDIVHNRIKVYSADWVNLW